MAFTSIGDLSRNFHSARQTFQIKSDLNRLSQELSSGKKSDLGTAMSGDILPLLSLERSISAIQAHATSAAEARLFAETMQLSLAQVQSHSEEFAPNLLTAASSHSATTVNLVADDAFSRLDAVISSFNTRIADRYAFAGVDVSGPALADARTMLDDIVLNVAGLTDAASIEAAVDNWFDAAGGGFETIGYLGSFDRLAQMRVAPGDAVDLSMTAADPEPREVLKGFALAALLGEGILATDLDERIALTEIAGTRMVSAQYDLTVFRSRIGTAEARIETALSNSNAQKALYEMARSELIVADPFETASKLEEVRSQLDTIFAVTARLSQLSLTNYLR